MEDVMYYIYILTNQSDTVMYIGVTNDLKRRIYEHRSGLVEGFTKRYHVHKLVYYETFRNINNAIRREKQLKGWVREKKNRLVETANPRWNDLAEILPEE
ncbi:MAG: GIY-YIG nuclease family protein [Clostridia bacterium]|nr:GIY-YIG nuclease family protein [Clostridia bacterium]